MRRLTAAIVFAGSVAVAAAGVLAQEHQHQHPQSGATTKSSGSQQQRDIDHLNQMRSQLYPDAPKHDMGGMSGHDMGAMGGQAVSGQAGTEHQHKAQGS